MSRSEAPDNPRLWRLLVAFAVAPAVAALLMALVEPLYAGLPSYFERVWRTAYVYALFGAYPPTLVVGIPTYLILRSKVAATWINCAIAGGFVAGLPWLVLSLLPSGADQASIDGQATVIDGTRTAYGWVVGLESVGEIAVFGLAAGVVFWAIAVSRWQTSQGN